ncbi:FAD-binding oxidoreductase [Coralliovum pocilloporae]|uniref:FAD-binding oxidoreductase n=1 Tax=Coralliovum pocilloporae TaxID=3066369 RepID=UPI003D9C3FF6
MTSASRTQAALEEFIALLGRDTVLLPDDDQHAYLVEWRNLYRGRTPAVLRPDSTEAVARIIQIANNHKVPLVPQGGNTGLVGGQVPSEDGQEFVLSLSRLNRIREVDASGNSMTVEAGVTLEAVQQAAENADRLFPLSLASQGTCQIGGNLSTNAGGTGVLAYGSARDLVLGLEVVLPTGEIWNGLRKLRKDNTGYDLKQLFLGAEGTLGIITAAVLKLFPAPLKEEAAFVAVHSPEDALALFNTARAQAGTMLTAFELMPRIGVDFALRHLSDTRDPIERRYPWYVLMNLSTSQPDASPRRLIESILSGRLEAGQIADAALAESLQHSQEFWALRHGLSEVQKHEGGSIKHDISVPVASIPAFLNEALPAVEAFLPGARPVPFGHMGDGNLHFNVSQPVGMDKAAFLALWDDMNRLVHDIVLSYDGSISAEHGIGRLKRDLLAEVKDPLELAMMHRLKDSFDPNHILNPGRVLKTD